VISNKLIDMQDSLTVI